jgi:hypothetical protein
MLARSVLGRRPARPITLNETGRWKGPLVCDRWKRLLGKRPMVPGLRPNTTTLFGELKKVRSYRVLDYWDASGSQSPITWSFE